MALARTLAQATWNVLQPVSCPGCGRADVVLCGDCAAVFHDSFVVPELAHRHALRGVDVVAVTAYTGVARRVVLAFKDHGAHRLACALAKPMARNVLRLCEGERDSLVVVPVPSSRSGWIARGFEPSLLLARHIARSIPGSRVHRGLARAVLTWPATASHWGGSRTERLGPRAPYRAHPRLNGARVVLVDDVITTGATLEHAATALHSVGAEIVAALVVAAHPSALAPGLGSTDQVTAVRSQG